MTENKAIDKTVACSLKIEREKRSKESTFVEREMKKIKIFVYNMSVYWLYRSEKERKKNGGNFTALDTFKLRSSTSCSYSQTYLKIVMNIVLLCRIKGH